jgi:2'-5' RNA ligase superfamily
VGFSAITVPVAELEPVVAPRLRRSRRDYMFADPACVHAHITLLGPFAPRELLNAALLADLARYFADAAPFAFAFERSPRILASRWVCLDPQPAESFATLTQGLTAAYPDYPPYGGEIDDPCPHLTLEYEATTAVLHELAAELAPALPVRAVADRAVLTWYEPGRTEQLGSFPFGG